MNHLFSVNNLENRLLIHFLLLQLCDSYVIYFSNSNTIILFLLPNPVYKCKMNLVSISIGLIFVNHMLFFLVVMQAYILIIQTVTSLARTCGTSRDYIHVHVLNNYARVLLARNSWSCHGNAHVIWPRAQLVPKQANGTDLKGTISPCNKLIFRRKRA